MSARDTHWNSMIPELDAMREAVASAAHVETDRTSHLAYMMQAKSLRAVYGAITSIWFNTAQELGSVGPQNEEAVELRYVERLSHWLRTHESQTADAMEGGTVDAANVRSGLTKDELSVIRRYAARHHDMIGEFCIRHAAALEARAGEIVDTASVAFAP